MLHLARICSNLRNLWLKMFHPQGSIVHNLSVPSVYSVVEKATSSRDPSSPIREIRAIRGGKRFIGLGSILYS
ncbi:hypothetical protein SAMN02745181_0314 [Rubritalea squalenifaciens DSM 18772]|uniref:Uncharacterized protein n=1 Tax=Rubritalea squalenifaciens DSM 18772 TaxID=1123071 RepID=A0A1M6BUN5_9BACT|nr:hypothetical protein SAMN02745181_0314 [Rubritalea squalenifaciens DSM 18772]